MSNFAIRCEGLGKKYRIGERERYKALRDTVTDAMYAPFRRLRSAFGGTIHVVKSGRADTTFWALRDLSFEIKSGEVVGVIGRNGAGKSTLLKILSRITAPTEGEVEIRGRVGSLLEVGTGFHPELTGRENIYLNGAILGMRRVEIDQKLDEIVSFAEIENFIDTPVKRYSSGMYMRLAFSVAAHLEPQILVIDEVLAVGDVQFQKKCLGKMGDIAKKGRTVLFVSHNMAAVQTLCTRSIWLHEGKLVEDGTPGHVVSNYLKTSFSTSTECSWEDVKTAPGSDTVRLKSIRVRPVGGMPSDPITVKTPFVMEFDYLNLEPGAYLNLSLHIINEQGVTVFNTGPINESVWQGKPFPKGLFHSVCHVPGNLLNNGMHKVQLLVVKNQGSIDYSHDEALVFEVRDADREGYFGEWPGAVRPDLMWTTEFKGTAKLS